MDSLNAIASTFPSGFPPKKTWDELVVNQNYQVTEIRRVETRFGNKIVFVINQGFSQFQIFVPPRVSKVLYENDVLFENLAAKANKLELYIENLGNTKFRFM